MTHLPPTSTPAPAPAPAPDHGGDLAAASAEFGCPKSGWTDLSTGISPWSYPVERLPQHIWQQLPGDDLPLREAAAEYYQVPREWIIPVPGSQYALARIPHQVPRGRVALPVLGYGEHQKAWQKAGHQGVYYRDNDHLMRLVTDGLVEHLVLINPNNPTGEIANHQWLRKLAEAHKKRGLLLVDEAFADSSSTSHSAELIQQFSNLWVLRSIGKFFGLAGLRLGFLLGRDGPLALAQPITEALSPWGISHPAHFVGTQALRDIPWQAQQRARLQQTCAHLNELWLSTARGRWSVHSGGLFVTLRGAYSVLYPLYQALGQQGIYLRWCHWSAGHAPQGLLPWLRCGLPTDEGIGLQQALTRYGALPNTYS